MNSKSDLAVAVAELWHWKYGNATNFHALLYDLITKADYFNRQRLRLGFPAEVQAFDEWQASPDEAQFFLKHGFSRKVGA